MPQKELLYIDMDGVLADFHLQINKVRNDPRFSLPETKHYHHIPGFYLDMVPVSGAIEAFKVLSETYNVYILSAPSWTNISSWTDKRIWIEQYLGEDAFQKLILCHNKALFTGRALIDDRTVNGQADFNGEFIHFGTDPFLNWSDVLEHIL